MAAFWLGETGQIWDFWTLSGECIGEMACNLACWWCILTTFRTDEILVRATDLVQFWLNDMRQLLCCQWLEGMTTIMACCLRPESNFFFFFFFQINRGKLMYVGEWRHIFEFCLVFTLNDVYSSAYSSYCFLDTLMVHLVEILSHGKQKLISHTQSMPWLLMTWQCKEPRHH